MSKIQERIKEIDKSAKRSRLIAIILSIVIIGFVVVTGYLLNEISGKNTALVENEVVIKAKNDTLNKANDELRFLKNKLEEKEQEYKIKIDSIAKANSGSDLWDFTKTTNTIEGYSKYIETEGTNNIPQDQINEIKDAILKLLNNEDWVQIKESNGKELFEKASIFENIGDVRRAKSARSVRIGVMGIDPNSGRNGDVISKGQYVLILETKASGKTDWARIKYSNKN